MRSAARRPPIRGALSGKFFPGSSKALGTSRYHKTFTFLTLPRPNPSIDCLSSVSPQTDEKIEER